MCELGVTYPAKRRKTQMAKKKSNGGTVAALFSVTFDREKDTKRTTRFREDIEEGRGERGWVESIYLKMPLLEKASRVTATFFEASEEETTNIGTDGSTPKGEKPTVVFAIEPEKETKNAYRYAEILEEGVERGWVGTVYLKKKAFEGSPPQFIKVELEG